MAKPTQTTQKAVVPTPRPEEVEEVEVVKPQPPTKTKNKGSTGDRTVYSPEELQEKIHSPTHVKNRRYIYNKKSYIGQADGTVEPEDSAPAKDSYSVIGTLKTLFSSPYDLILVGKSKKDEQLFNRYEHWKLNGKGTTKEFSVCVTSKGTPRPYKIDDLPIEVNIVNNASE
jgi:hypothetical protein